MKNKKLISGKNIVIYTDSESTSWSFISETQEKIIEKCQVNHSGPRGTKNYAISLEKKENTEFYRRDNISCSFKIPQVHPEHYGEWIVITSFGDKNISEKVTIYEKKVIKILIFIFLFNFLSTLLIILMTLQVVKPLPSEILFVNQGDNLTIKINESVIFGDNYDKKVVKIIKFTSGNFFKPKLSIFFFFRHLLIWT